MRQHQKYDELSWVIDATEYANSNECPKKAAKHIKLLVKQATSYRDAMHKWQDKLDSVKDMLK